MKLLRNMVMLSILSTLSMTGMTLGLTQAHAQKVAVTQDIKDQQKELINLFFAAARTGQKDVINEFLKHGFPVDVRNQDGYTALMMSAYYGHQDIVTTLLKNGADRCLRDNRGNTALMGAIFKLEWSIAKQLRQVDCDAQAKQTGQKTTEEFAKIIGQDQQLKKITEAYAKKQSVK